MSIPTILLVILAAALALALAVTVIAMASPVVLVVDTAGGEVRLRWLVALEYRRALPWREGETRLSFAGIALHAPERKAKAKRERKKRARGRRAKTPLRFLVRCLRDPGLRRTLAGQVASLIGRIFRSADFTRWHADVSLPDPATTGMLYGFTQFGWGRRMGVAANFTSENQFFLEIRLHPHRIVRAVLSFLTGLPYRAMFRAWRTASAGATAQ